MTRRLDTFVLTVLAIVTPALSFGQAASFDIGGPAHRIEHFVDILNCCTHFAIANDNTPETSISVSGPPWAPPNNTGDYGSATARSSTTIQGSTSGAVITAVVSASSTPGTTGVGLNAHAGQGGTYYSFTLAQPMVVALHGSVSFAHSSGGSFAASFSLRAGSSGGGIVSGSSMDVNSGSNPDFTTGSVHTPPTMLPAGTYFLIAAISGVSPSSSTGAPQNFFASLTVNLRIQDPVTIGTVSCLTGTATITTPGGTPQTLAMGSSVHLGDVIETGDQSRVCVTFIDATHFTMSGRGKSTIDQYVYDPDPQESKSTFTSVLTGAFRYVSGLLAKKPDPDVQLNMDTAGIGVRGTEFIGKLDSTQTVQEIYLNEGEIDVTPWHSGLTSSFQAPVIVRFTIDGIVGSEPLSQEIYDALKRDILGIETTPPTTTISFVPNAPDGTNSWNRQDVSVALSATDTESGVESSTYEIDGGATTTYAGPFLLTTDGAHTLTYRSSDQAGNVESDKSAGVKIDKTKPTNIAFVGAIHAGDTFSSGSVPPNNTCAATDATSGVASCVVTGYDTSPGSHTLAATATDNAGNSDSIRLSYSVSAPTAAPHPIGYWRNNPAITGALLPQSLGSYLVDTSTKASAVFNAPTSKNAFEMLAAQMLAAKLNQANGVVAGCVSGTIADATSLLTVAGYKGPGTTSPPAKNAKTAVTMDTNRLDAFNNLGCP